MSQVDFTTTSSVSFGELGPTTSLQLMFAKLQLELAGTAKTQAMDKMDAIATAQDEQKFVSQLLNEARQAQADGNSGTGVGMTSINGVTVTGKDCYPRLEELGTNTQQEMVYVQDYMGQYNSYLQGANTQIANSNQTLTNLARGQ